jgi:hypothetical protein
MQAVGSFKMLITTYQTTRSHNPEVSLNYHHCENLKGRTGQNQSYTEIYALSIHHKAY